MIKKKSLLVILISSFVIFCVLALTIVSYVIYVEIKSGEFKMRYQTHLGKVEAKIYSRYIEIPKLIAKVEGSGALKGMPVLEGVIKNDGQKNVANLFLKIKFLDKDGAVMYQVVFSPQESSLGDSGFVHVSIPYLSPSTRSTIKMNSSLSFKKIMSNCPDELLDTIAGSPGPSKWSGKLDSEVIYIDFGA